MGQNYTATYRKTYDGDYSKSYRDERQYRVESEKRRKEYERVSKKLDESPYNQSEKGVEYTGTRSTEKATYEKVDAAGPNSNIGVVERKPQMKSPRQHVYVETNPIEKLEHPEELLDISVLEDEPYKEMDEWADDNREEYIFADDKDLSYINIDSLNPPVENHGATMFKDMYTGRIINLEQARERLLYAGYKEKEPISIVVFVLLCFIALAVPIIGPGILITLGNGMKKNEIMSLEKKYKGRSFFYSIAISDKKRAENAKRGNIASVLGVLFLFLQLKSFF